MMATARIITGCWNYRPLCSAVSSSALLLAWLQFFFLEPLKDEAVAMVRTVAVAVAVYVQLLSAFACCSALRANTIDPDAWSPFPRAVLRTYAW